MEGTACAVQHVENSKQLLGCSTTAETLEGTGAGGGNSPYGRGNLCPCGAQNGNVSGVGRGSSVVTRLLPGRSIYIHVRPSRENIVRAFNMGWMTETSVWNASLFPARDYAILC